MATPRTTGCSEFGFDRYRSEFPSLSRRDWLRLSAAGVLGGSSSGWMETLAADAAKHPSRRRSVILLWMTGGPSQLDTFDLKPGHKNGGPYKPIQTAATGVQISEHLPQLAKQMKHVVPIRSMSTREGDHARGTFLMRTGYRPLGPVQYPTLGSLMSKELGRDDAELPNFISISPFRTFSPAAFGPGFLGPQFSPLIVGDAGYTFGAAQRGNPDQALKVRNLSRPSGVTRKQADARLGLLDGFEAEFEAEHPDAPPRSHRAAYHKALRMMRSDSRTAFDLDKEPAKTRDAYGRNQFGQGCLLARRLVERGVPFVEVTLSRVPGARVFGWDTHRNNFDSVKKLSGVLDPAWGTLLEDLKTRGLLDSTLVVWMGEFGRTPVINRGKGRDHFPKAWTTVLCGGGVRGGQTFGRTSPDGMKVTQRPVPVTDFYSTICHAVGIDPMKQNMSNVGRPIRIAAIDAKPIREILT